MKVLICGSRYWTDYNLIHDTLKPLPPDSLIITGGARGADSSAKEAAKKLNLECKVIRAKWEVYGRSAGPIRNREMLDMKPDIVIAFHSDLAESRGTKDCVREAQRRGITVRIIGGVRR